MECCPATYGSPPSRLDTYVYVVHWRCVWLEVEVCQQIINTSVFLGTPFQSGAISRGNRLPRDITVLFVRGLVTEGLRGTGINNHGIQQDILYGTYKQYNTVRTIAVTGFDGIMCCRFRPPRYSPGGGPATREIEHRSLCGV